MIISNVGYIELSPPVQARPELQSKEVVVAVP